MTKRDSPHTRDQAIEALRIMAAFAIVAFHAQIEDYYWLLSGLVVFVFLAAFYGVQQRPDRGRLARRMLVPFAFFYAVYGAANLVLGRPMFVQDHPVTMVLAGPSWHLWFLPFIFLVLVSAQGLARFRRMPDYGKQFAALGAGCLIVLGLAYEHIWQLAIPLPQAIRMVPVAVLGMAAGLLARRHRSLLYVPLIVGLIVCYVAPIAGFSLAVAIGLGGVGLAHLAARLWPRKLSVQPIADCMFGVYLTHIIALAIAARLVERGSMAQVFIAFALSLAGVWAARRFVPISRAVLG